VKHLTTARTFVARFATHQEEGASAGEYGLLLVEECASAVVYTLLLVLITVVCIAAIGVFGNCLSTLFSSAAWLI